MTSRVRILAASAWVGGLLIPAPSPAQQPREARERIADVLRSSVPKGQPIRAVTATSPSGLEFAEVSDAIQSQVGLPDGQGVVIVNVRPDSPGMKAGFKANDILLSVESQDIKGVAQAKEALARAKGKDTKVKIVRAGKTEEMNLKADLDDAHTTLRRLYVTARADASPRSEYWIGVPVSPVDATLRSHLGSLPPEAGLIVNDVAPGSPAEKAGLKKNDVLVTMDGKPLTSPKALVEQVLASEGKPVSLEYLRAGKATTVKITPEKHEVLAERAIEVQGDRLFLKSSAGQLFDFGLATGPDPNRYLLRERKPLQGLAAKEIEPRTRIDGAQASEVEAATKRLEAAIKDLTAKVEDVRKSVEQIRKADGKDAAKDEK